MKELSLEATACRRDYMRKWRAKNRDKVREYNARYWAKRLEREKKAAPGSEVLAMEMKSLHPITREQVEKMRGEWVQVAYELAHLKCSECNHSINRFYGVSEFCPSCGAPMTDKAVDIPWKRLEGNLNV